MKRGGMKRALGALLALLLVLGAALYFFVARPLLRPSEVTAVAERALATDDLVLLGGVNVKQAVFLERWFFGRPPAAPGAPAPAPPAADRTLLDHLPAAGVDPRHDVDYALYALYPATGEAVRHALVLVGRFNPGALNVYLGRELRATPSGGPGSATSPATFEVTRTDPVTCRPDAAWLVTTTPEWILLADPASHALLLPRLADAPPAAGDKLAWWRGLARTDVAGVGIPGLDGLESGATQPFARRSAKSLATEADAFGRLYVGVGVKTVPPQGVLRVVIDAKDPARAAQRIAAWEKAVNESRARWAQQMPSVAALYDSLKVHVDGARSSIEFTVDRTLAANSQRVVNELLGAALGGLGVRMSGPTAAAGGERIDSDPVAFVPAVAPAALPPYDPGAQFAEDVDQIQGPFGLRFGEMRVSSEPGVGLELVVEGFAAEIPNLGGGGDRARLVVSSVKSASGQEVLRPEACGRERNDKPVAFTTWGAHRLRAAKTMRLIEGVDPGALQSLSGRVELRLPTRTEIVALPHPAAGAVAERYGATFTVTRLGEGSVAYQIAGARDRVLFFRALNAKGQPLASPSSFSSEFMFGEGISGQKDYAGAIDRLEVVFAAEEQSIDLPFTLTDLSLAPKSPGAGSPDRTAPFRPYGYQALSRDYPRPRGAADPLAPFELSLDRVQGFFGLKLDFTLRSPDVPNFQRAFAVGRLRLTRLLLADGTVVVPSEPDPAAQPGSLRSRWETSIRFTGGPKDGVLSTPVSVFTDAKAKPEDLKTVQGILTMQFPRTLETLAIEDLGVGREARLGELTVTVVARGRKSVTLQTSRDGDRVIYVRLIGADGQPVAFFTPNVVEAPGGVWRFELSPLGTPVRAEVVLARDLDRKAYPVTLAPR